MKKLFQIIIVAIFLILIILGCFQKPYIGSLPINPDTQTTNPPPVNNDTQTVSPTPTNQDVYTIDYDKIFADEDEKQYAKIFINTKAPDFILVNLQGKEIQLSNYKGKNILLEIAQTTCSSCIEMYPIISEFQDKSDVVVIKVYPLDTKETIDEFFTQNGLEPKYDIIAGNEHMGIIESYKIKYNPTFFFIDKEGIIKMVRVGSMPEELFNQMVQFAFGETEQ